jgi:hypothetical protein
MKAAAVIYVDVRGAEHDALVRAVNNFHEGYVDLVYVDADAPEGDNVKTVFSVPHMDDESKKEPNPTLPQIHLNVWKEHYRVHGEPAPDHPIFDSPYEEKQKDEFGKPLVKERPEYEAQVTAHKESQTGLPSGEDLDAVVETKHYSDGYSATGVAPLPDLSPEQQKAQEEEAQKEAEYGQPPDSEKDYPKRADGTLDR